MRRNYYTPRSIRRLEKKGKRKLFFRLLIGAILIVVIIFWGLPLLIGGLSVFNNLKTDSESENEKISQALTPPVLNIPFEATNSSKLSLSGYATQGAKVEIYLDDDLVAAVDTLGDGSFETEPIQLALGTNNVYGKTVDKDGSESLPSKTIRFSYIKEKPTLELSSPNDGEEFSGEKKKIEVSGNTDSDIHITVNSTTAIVASDGKFSKLIELSEGSNSIIVIASDNAGNSTTIARTVSYTP